MNINKSDLVNQLKEEYGYTKKSAAEFVDDVLDLIMKNLEEGNTVSLHGFGTFDYVKRNARSIKDVHTGEMRDIPEHWNLKFKPGKYMSIAIKKWQDSVERGLI